MFIWNWFFNIFFLHQIIKPGQEFSYKKNLHWKELQWPLMRWTPDHMLLWCWSFLFPFNFAAIFKFRYMICILTTSIQFEMRSILHSYLSLNPLILLSMCSPMNNKDLLCNIQYYKFFIEKIYLNFLDI